MLQEHAIIIHTKYYSLVIINLGKKNWLTEKISFERMLGWRLVKVDIRMNQRPKTQNLRGFQRGGEKRESKGKRRREEREREVRM